MSLATLTIARQLPCATKQLTCGNGRISSNRGPRRVLVTLPGHGRSAEEIDVTEVTPACAKPSVRYPQGRTGTEAGYAAHRYIKQEPCELCRRAIKVRSRAYYEANTELVNQRSRARQVAMAPGERRAYQRDWYAANVERQREKSRAWREANPEKASAHRRIRAELVAKIKSVPCLDCGVQYPPYVMQFDHRDPSAKSFTIGENASRFSLDVVLAEIAKCDVVCANCHAERTHQQQSRKGAQTDAVD